MQPPGSDDTLRDDVTSLLSDAEDAVAHARIAIRRSDGTATGKAAVELRKVAADLAAAEKRLS